jgi:hypothetical protein
MSDLSFDVLVIAAGAVAIFYPIARSRHRKNMRNTAYNEGLEEYDLELNRLLELRRLAPKDNPGPDPYSQALENVRLQSRVERSGLPELN